MASPRAADPEPEPPRLGGFLVVLVLFFVLPAVLYFRLASTAGPGRVAVQILALTLPATGALILRVNPDLVPDREGLRAMPASAWVRLLVSVAVLAGVAWWLVGQLGGGSGG